MSLTRKSFPIQEDSYMIEENRHIAGADERTPSHPQYFSWISNTNEGSTEAQTLVNLDYFGYLRRRYGMILEIYAWDAGNLDSARGSYQTLDSDKLRAQFPNGYAPLAEAAEKTAAVSVSGAARTGSAIPRNPPGRVPNLWSPCAAIIISWSSRLTGFAVCLPKTIETALWP